MNKKIVLFEAIIMIIFVIITCAGVWYWQNTQTKSKIRGIDKKITSAKTEISKIKATQDEKDYSPSDIIRNFIAEVRNDSTEKAKLYLSKDQQGMDIKTILGFDKDLDKITISEVEFTIEDDQATTILSGFWPTEDKTFEKIFVLIKEDNLWKINEVKEAQNAISQPEPKT